MVVVVVGRPQEGRRPVLISELGFGRATSTPSMPSGTGASFTKTGMPADERAEDQLAYAEEEQNTAEVILAQQRRLGLYVKSQNTQFGWQRTVSPRSDPARVNP